MDNLEVAICLATEAKKMWSYYTSTVQAEVLLGMTASPTSYHELEGQEKEGKDKDSQELHHRVEITEGENDGNLTEVALQDNNCLQHWEVMHLEDIGASVGEGVNVGEEVTLSTEPEFDEILEECLLKELKSETEFLIKDAAQVQTKDWVFLKANRCSSSDGIHLKGEELKGKELKGEELEGEELEGEELKGEELKDEELKGEELKGEELEGKELEGEELEGEELEGGELESDSISDGVHAGDIILVHNHIIDDVCDKENDEFEDISAIAERFEREVAEYLELDSESKVVAATETQHRYWEILGGKDFEDRCGADVDDGLHLEGDIIDGGEADGDHIQQSRDSHCRNGEANKESFDAFERLSLRSDLCEQHDADGVSGGCAPTESYLVCDENVCGHSDAISDDTGVNENVCGHSDGISDDTGVNENVCGHSDGISDDTGVNENVCGHSDGISDDTGVNENVCGHSDGISDDTGVNENVCGHSDGISDDTGVNENVCGHSDGISDDTGVNENVCGHSDGISDATGVNENICGHSDGISDDTGVNENICGHSDGISDATGVNENICGHSDGISDDTGVNENVCGHSDDISDDTGDDTGVNGQIQELVDEGCDHLIGKHTPLSIPSSLGEESFLGEEYKLSSIRRDAATNTIIAHQDRGTSPTPLLPLLSHTHSQTTLSIRDLVDQAKEKEELELMKVDLHVARGSLNKEKSQRMVAEELVKIIQSDLSDMSSRNTTEVMTRLQLENELTDVKGELLLCTRQLKERDGKIEEMEDILKGTSLMVRKMEEQNAVTLMNRGGIDYMLQARLADGRAKEAEQKLKILQAELLQSQSEVRMMLDQVSELSRDRAEMVSSKVHNQLMNIVDEKVLASERRVQMMEREIMELRRKLAASESRGGINVPQTGLTSSGLTDYGSSLYSNLLEPKGMGIGQLVESGMSGVGFGLTGMSSGLGSGLTGLSFGRTSLAGGLGTLDYGSSPYSSPSSKVAPSLEEQYNLQHFSTCTTSSTISSSASSFYTSTGVTHLSSDIGTKSHDWEENVPASSDVKKRGKHDFSLPSLVDTSERKLDSFAPLPRPAHTSSSHDNGSHGDSDSSVWSSSEDEGADMAVEMKPSSHNTLIAEWEWRAMNKDNRDTGAALAHSHLIVHNPKPTVAPKPVLFRSTSSSGEIHFTVEPSSSFDKPSHTATLQQHILHRPRGPPGRSIPSRSPVRNHDL